MKSFIKIALFVLLVVLAPSAVSALTLEDGVLINLSDLGINITVVGSNTIDSMTVNTGNFTVTMSAGQSLSLRSDDGRNIANTFGAATNCSGGTSATTITIPAGTAQDTYTVTPSASRLCAASTSGGGGGGGGGAGPADRTPPDAPNNVSVSDIKTGSSLKLAWTNPTNSDFSFIRIYRSTVSGVLGTLLPSAQKGTSFTDTNLIQGQIYYYTLRSVDTSGNESTNTNQVSSAPTKLASSAVQEIIGSVGGKVELTDKSAAIDLPAGAITGTASASISPTTSYTVPSSGFGVVGEQAFDIEVETGSTSVETFSQPVTLTFKYSDAQVAGLDESTLEVQYFDTNENKWISVSATVDEANNIITATIDHLTLFIVVGTKLGQAEAGNLVKLTCHAGAGVNDPCRSVYYLGLDGGRYVFPNETTYFSWYADFSGVIEISSKELASYPIKANVTIRPGTYLVKITTDPKVYAVETGGLLKWIDSENTAKRLWGDNWAKKVVDVPDTFFINYNSVAAIANKVSSVHPTGSLVKYTDSSTVYYIEAGKKRAFAASASFSDNGFRNEFVVTIPSSITYDSGSNITGIENKLKTTAGPI